MRLLTFETAGQRRLGAEAGGYIVDLQNAFALSELIGYGAAAGTAAANRLPSDTLAFLQGGEATGNAAKAALEFVNNLPPDVTAHLADNSAVLHRPGNVRLRAPIARPGKVMCIGLNYADHAAESGVDPPTEPVVFTKYSNAIIGPGDAIVLPSDSEEVDYECELVFVIGKRGKDVPKEEAMDHVAGYTCGHDVSARDYQLKRGGGQWTVGKTFDTFGPTGPVIVMADEDFDPHHAAIRTVLNGQTMQDSNTEKFIFTIPEVVAYLSHVITLEPGDLVFTGTPPGVGFARKPPVFLKDGDEVEIQIDGIGVLNNPVKQAEAL